MSTIHTLFDAEGRRRLIKFMVVGASGTTIDLVLLSILINRFGMATIPANTISFGAGVINNYLLNRFWTFPEARSTSALAQFLRFATINVVGLILSDLIVAVAQQVLYGWFGSASYLPVKLLSIGLVFFWNFTANRLWTFNDAGRQRLAQSLSLIEAK